MRYIYPKRPKPAYMKLPFYKLFGKDTKGKVWFYRGHEKKAQDLIAHAKKEIPGFKPVAIFNNDAMKPVVEEIKQDIKSYGLFSKFRVGLRRYKTGTDMISIYADLKDYSMSMVGFNPSVEYLTKKLENLPAVKKYNHCWRGMAYNGIPHAGPFASIFSTVSEF